MGKSSKGANFEREICKKLSLWWSNGERDDIFWRTAGSGAMATTRRKRGKNTFGQEGDIQAVDPIGQPLLDKVVIELKRGYSSNTLSDLLDIPNNRKEPQYVTFIKQAIRESKAQGTKKNWMLIIKRDRRDALIFLYYNYFSDSFINFRPKKYIILKNRKYFRERIIGLKLDEFLKNVEPKIFI